MINSLMFALKLLEIDLGVFTYSVLGVGLRGLIHIQLIFSQLIDVASDTNCVSFEWIDQ